MGHLEAIFGKETQPVPEKQAWNPSLRGEGICSKGSFPGHRENDMLLVTLTPPASRADRPTHPAFLCGGRAKPGLLRIQISFIYVSARGRERSD